MKDPTEYPPTKAKLLNAAERLMLTKGFSATSVDEICEAAKLTKGSFFHYFESKDRLGQELLERFAASAEATQRAGGSDDSDPLKRVFGHVEVALTLAKSSRSSLGCLLGVFAQELSDTHPAIRSVCARAFKQWARRLKADLDAAKARYAPRADIDTMSLAQHFIAVVEGSKILARAEQDTRLVERSLTHFRRYVEALFKRR